MYYLVNGYRFITHPKKINLKILEMDAAKICVHQKSASKEFPKSFPTYFFNTCFGNIQQNIFSKRSTNTFWQHSAKRCLHQKITQKSASKDFIKTFPTYFLRIFTVFCKQTLAKR